MAQSKSSIEIVLRTRRKKHPKDGSVKDKISQETPDERSGKGDVKPDNCDWKGYTDSEDEEYERLYDLSVRTPRAKMDEEMSEPFSLDLDIAWNHLTEQPEVMQDMVEGPQNEPESNETMGETVLQETIEIQEQAQDDETLDAENHLSQDTESETETRRTQRVKRAPSRLTYDTLGQPSVIAAPIVKYVSCLYKWICAPLIT